MSLRRTAQNDNAHCLPGGQGKYNNNKNKKKSGSHSPPGRQCALLFVSDRASFRFGPSLSSLREREKGTMRNKKKKKKKISRRTPPKKNLKGSPAGEARKKKTFVSPCTVNLLVHSIGRHGKWLVLFRYNMSKTCLQMNSQYDSSTFLILV